MVSLPAFAVALIGFRIDDIEIDPRLDTQVGLFQAALDDVRTADQDRTGEFLFDDDLNGTQDTLLLALGVDDALTLGLAGGFYGGKVDMVIMRLCDIVLAFPSLLLAMVVMYTLGATLVNIFIALAAVGWAGTARVVRSQVLSLKEKEFVEAAVAQGKGPLRIMVTELLPNIVSTIIVFFTLNIANNMLLESALSFLGAGVRPPNASWGTMIAEGYQTIYTAPHLTIVPGLMIVLTVLSLNVFGDGLRAVIQGPQHHQCGDSDLTVLE